jgi:hypothetical protein
VKPKDKHEFTVNMIRGRFKQSGKWYNIVSWEGYSEKENTIEPDSNILDKGLIKTYQATKKWTWEYFGDDGMYHAMPDRLTNEIEDAYQKWLQNPGSKTSFGSPASVEYLHQKDKYSTTFRYKLQMDLACPLQQNLTHQDHNERVCRRVPSDVSSDG